MNDYFDIIALNGISGECMTTADQDEWYQRTRENPPEPELTHEQFEAIRQEHETFFTQLESLAVKAILLGDWSNVYDHINFNAPQLEEP